MTITDEQLQAWNAMGLRLGAFRPAGVEVNR